MKMGRVRKPIKRTMAKKLSAATAIAAAATSAASRRVPCVPSAEHTHTLMHSKKPLLNIFHKDLTSEIYVRKHAI